ncbi:MBL fold metallo-hydrolase [Actinomadura kijaniata]|uniref:MBL fold metallo-hydrolase n=1 Tax=Actinomadura kijaniata TaxID=46161 RepID=UPI000830932D|nr:MBL fold metallo-hydrolase [Actinomadura kijaniata]
MTTNRLTTPSGPRTLTLGDLRLTYVPDGDVRLKPRGWFPASTDADWAARPEYLADDGNLVASLGGLLVEHGDRALLIDTGFGPVTLPDDPANALTGAVRSGALPDSLAALGRAPADVEAVAITHLHPDHLGWQDRFATVLVAAPEWADREHVIEHGTPAETLDALAPRVRTFTDGEEVFPGVRTRITAGHTPGHTVYEITSGGRRLLAFGDALHSPAQAARPDWSAAVDHDPELAAKERALLVAELSEPDTLGFGVHFADVPFGRVRDGRWEPVA